MHRKISLIGAVAGLGLVLATATTVPTGAASVLPPSITARPDNVMVNTGTTLTGRNLTPRTTLRIIECSQTGWVVLQNPCSSGNGITVTTNAKGRFRAQMKVEACPGGVTSVGTGVSKLCYIGVQRLGIDTIALDPHTSIVVTFP